MARVKTKSCEKSNREKREYDEMMKVEAFLCMNKL